MNSRAHHPERSKPLALSDSDEKGPHDALGPEKYNDPREVLKYQLDSKGGQAGDEERVPAPKSAKQDDLTQTGISIPEILYAYIASTANESRSC